LAFRKYEIKRLIIIIFFISILIELIQSKVGRTPEIEDVARNLIGFLGGYYIINKKFFVLIFIVLIMEQELIVNYFNNSRLVSSYTTIYDGEMNWLERSYDCYNCEVIFDGYLNVKYGNKVFSGIVLRNIKKDWSKFKELELEIYNENNNDLFFLFFVNNDQKKYFPMIKKNNRYTLDIFNLNEKGINTHDVKRFGVFKGKLDGDGFSVVIKSIELK
jgi:hypothetical protein